MGETSKCPSFWDALHGQRAAPRRRSASNVEQEERREVPLQLDQRYFHLHIPKTADERLLQRLLTAGLWGGSTRPYTWKNHVPISSFKSLFLLGQEGWS